MAIKYIPTSWKRDLLTNYAHDVNFYINPRGRVFPAMAPAGITYIKNDLDVNMRGTYRMQCGASTLLQYVFTLPQRFIIEGRFKPEFAYNVAGNQTLFACGDAEEFSIIYNATTDKIDMIQNPGTTLSTSAYTSNASLQSWHYIRAWYDNTGKLAGLYLLANGVSVSDSQNVPGAGAFITLNTISILPAVAAESSYWIIHELDETLATGQYKTYQADRQIIFDFNGTTLGRERIRIPRTRDSTDLRGVKDYTIQKTGSGKANTANLNLYNFFGQWSDDQYDAFNPFQGYYNGPQKYLQNRVGVEIEDVSPANTVRDGLVLHNSFDDMPAVPDGIAGRMYVNDAAWTGWGVGGGSLSVVNGVLVFGHNGAYQYLTLTTTLTAGKHARLRARITSGTPSTTNIDVYVYGQGDNVGTIPIDGSWGVIDIPLAYSGALLYLYAGGWGSANVYTMEVSDFYLGDGSYAAGWPRDNSGSGNHGTACVGVVPCAGVSGNAAQFDGVGAHADATPSLGSPDKYACTFWMRQDGTTDRIPVIIGNGFNADGFYIQGGAGSSAYVLYVCRAGATEGPFTVATLTAGVWTKIGIVVSCAAKTYAVYINGAYSSGGSLTNTPLPPANKLSLGYYAGGFWFPGAIDEFRIYTRALAPEEIAYLYTNPGDWGTINKVEPVFIGRTTPGAFSRNSPNWQESMVSVDAEDGISELGETKLARSYAYNNDGTAYTLAQTADESLSLVHLITRLVTKHEIRNYALNSSFENATIGNSWLAGGLTLTRDATPQFGTYGAKAVATTGQAFWQTVKFETVDFIDQGEIFNFSAFVRQGTASTVKLQLSELDNTGTQIGSLTETACGTDTGVFTRVNVARAILSPLCTQLRITFYAVGNSTFYADGVMLTRGIDPLDYFVLNANDGASGIGSAESYASYLYDTKAIDTAVSALSHPYAIVNKGDTAWDHLKDINEALIPRYVGETCDGVLKFDFAYNETDPAIIGAIEDVASIQTSLDVNQENSIKVEGILIEKASADSQLWNGSTVTGIQTNTGGAMLHPITSGDWLTIQGVTTIEAKLKAEE
jgi:hypothetical protein